MVTFGGRASRSGPPLNCQRASDSLTLSSAGCCRFLTLTSRAGDQRGKVGRGVPHASTTSVERPNLSALRKRNGGMVLGNSARAVGTQRRRSRLNLSAI